MPSLICPGIEAAVRLQALNRMCDVSQQDVAGHAETWYALLSWLDRCKCIKSLPLQVIPAPLWTEMGYWDCATLHSRRLPNRLSNTNLQLMLSRTITAGTSDATTS